MISKIDGFNIKKIEDKNAAFLPGLIFGSSGNLEEILRELDLKGLYEKFMSGGIHFEILKAKIKKKDGKMTGKIKFQLSGY